MKLCCLHSIWCSQTLKGRSIILLKVMQKNLTGSRSCLLCSTDTFFGERPGNALASDLGSLGCFGNVWFFISLTFSFAVTSTAEFLVLFSGSSLMSVTTSFPTTNSFISSLVPSCYLLWATLLHRHHVGGKEQCERCVLTYHSWNYRSSQFGCGWLHHLLSPREWSPEWWFQP